MVDEACGLTVVEGSVVADALQQNGMAVIFAAEERMMRWRATES
jgi:hypothetical protein